MWESALYTLNRTLCYIIVFDINEGQAYTSTTVYTLIRAHMKQGYSEERGINTLVLQLLFIYICIYGCECVVFTMYACIILKWLLIDAKCKSFYFALIRSLYVSVTAQWALVQQVVDINIIMKRDNSLNIET